MEAFEIVHAVRNEGVKNPDIFVARLKQLPGMTTARAREILALEGIQTDGLVDGRLTTVDDINHRQGFVR